MCERDWTIVHVSGEHVSGGNFPDKPPSAPTGGVLLGKNGTFRIPVDSFQETSGGSRMVIRISNLYDSSTSTTNQRQRNEVYQTPRFRAPDAYPYRNTRVAASRCLRQNDS